MNGLRLPKHPVFLETSIPVVIAVPVSKPRNGRDLGNLFGLVVRRPVPTRRVIITAPAFGVLFIDFLFDCCDRYVPTSLLSRSLNDNDVVRALAEQTMQLGGSLRVLNELS